MPALWTHEHHNIESWIKPTTEKIRLEHEVLLADIDKRDVTSNAVDSFGRNHFASAA